MEKIQNVIAERSLLFKKDTGEIVDCKITIGAPFESDFGFSCSFIISGFSDSKVRTVHGFDSFQALKTAYEILNTFFCIYQRDGQFGLDENDTIGDNNILPRNLYNGKY